jgi:hypothetical protein
MAYCSLAVNLTLMPSALEHALAQHLHTEVDGMEVARLPQRGISIYVV